MKQKVTIVGNGFASLFFIGAFLGLSFFPFSTFFLRRVYSNYDITVIGDGHFIYCPSIPEFILGKKTGEGINHHLLGCLTRLTWRNCVPKRPPKTCGRAEG